MSLNRVLIVSPHFPPVNAADMQRTRLALPYLRELGWVPTVLAVAPESIEGAVIDEVLLRTYPEDIRVIRVKGISSQYTRWAGIGSLWWRCGRALRVAGERLLKQERFDLVFFSTTQFDAFTLGPRWLSQFGVPYVLDYQDPWINDYYRENNTRPPGGPLKYWLSQFTARRREPKVLRRAAGVMAVSSSYGRTLEKRYPWFSAASVVTIPFGTSALDLEIARKHVPTKNLVPSGDGNVHHVYTGRCGPDMTISLTILFRAFKMFLDLAPDDACRHRFHFIGTDYAPPPLGRFWALPIAESEGIAAYVEETCYRVPYFDALHYITQADALVIVGSNDPSYSASKLAPYLLAERPLIAITHDNSQMVPMLRTHGIPNYCFKNEFSVESLAQKILQTWFLAYGFSTTIKTQKSALADAEAAAMTRKMVEVFAGAVHNARRQNQAN